jgi:hypothetical protein
LAGSERELVRRYFERLRNRRSTTGGDKR